MSDLGFLGSRLVYAGIGKIVTIRYLMKSYDCLDVFFS